MTNRNKLLAKLHILITQQSVDKEALYTSYGVESATQMSSADLIDCINKLEKPVQRAFARTNEEIKKLRSEVLCLLTRSPEARDPRKRGLGIPNDWAVLNPWIARHGGKSLPEMTFDELLAFKKQLLALRAKDWYYGKKEVVQSSPRQSAITSVYLRPGGLPS